MIHTVWPYLAVMLLAAGLFPALERRFGWQLFSVLPPIVLTYLLVTALAVSGLWQVNAEIQAAQSMLVARLVPALLFLLMINCDLRAIFALGPRVLGGVRLHLGQPVRRLHHHLPDLSPLAAGRCLATAGRAVSGSWVGGTANMIAVKQAIGMSDALLAMSLLTDALCYSMWVVVLFSVARLAPAFNRWTRAKSSADLAVGAGEADARRPRRTACCCGWAWRLLAAALCRLAGGAAADLEHGQRHHLDDPAGDRRRAWSSRIRRWRASPAPARFPARC